MTAETMKCLVFDKSSQDWDKSRGFALKDMPLPVLDETLDPADGENGGGRQVEADLRGGGEPLRLDVDRIDLTGTLRDQPVAARGAFRYLDGRLVAQDLNLSFADSELSLDGDLASTAGLAFRGRIESLADFLDGGAGSPTVSVGAIEGAVARTVRYCKEREAFGKTLADQQAVQFKLADMATELEAAQCLTLQAAAIKEAGQPCLKQACMAKLFASAAAERICSGAVQILGGYGYTRDYPVEKIYRDVRVCQIYEGTSDVQKLIISRQLDH